MWQIVGHEAAVGLLDRSLKNGRLAHAYLLVGPPHVGKMRLAKELAKALNCSGEDRPCGVCAQCRRIEGGSHADVQVIGVDAKTEIGIDQMREMQHCASLKPFEGRCRVFIVDGAEHLSREATNCLLKTLEEPPPAVQLMVLTANDRSVLPTVLSRCQRLELQPLPLAVVQKALVERSGIGPERAAMLAHVSGGCLGWAMAAVSDDRILEERSEKLSALLRLHRADSLERFTCASDLAGRFLRDRESVYRVLSLWTTWWRDLLLIKSGCSQFICNIDYGERLDEEAQSYGMRQAKEFLNNLRQVKVQLEQNANPRLVLDVLMLSLTKRKGEQFSQ
ncbi:MAG: ATP-binding protein [Chloroflexota bacterium]